MPRARRNIQSPASRWSRLRRRAAADGARPRPTRRPSGSSRATLISAPRVGTRRCRSRSAGAAVVLAARPGRTGRDGPRGAAPRGGRPTAARDAACTRRSRCSVQRVSIAVRRACVTAIVAIEADQGRGEPASPPAAGTDRAPPGIRRRRRAPATTQGSDGRRSHSAAATPAASVNTSHHGGR